MKKFSMKFFRLFGRDDFLLEQRRMRSSPARNLHNILWERAAQQSADFVEPYLPQVMIFDSKPNMWNYVAQKQNEIRKGGVFLEFGVAGATSINWLSHRMPSFKFYGFDSFVGLAEDWMGHHATKGAYSRHGKLPQVNKNVSLIEGWFDVTIPKFIEERSDEIENINLIHIYGDTY